MLDKGVTFVELIKQVMKRFLLPVMLLLLLGSCKGPFNKRVKGNGILAKETRLESGFDKIKVKGPIDLVFQQSDHFEVVLEAEENILPYIRTRVSGGELIVDFRDNINVTTHEKTVVYVKAPAFAEFTTAGSGNIIGEDKINSTGTIRFVTAGSGDISADVNCPAIIAKISGSGNISINGETRDQEIDIAGSGDVDNGNLKTENTKIKIAGSGSADVHASVKLDISVAGNGNVTYRGNPTITQKIVGSGEVKKVN
jgi:hypothetical protein